MAESFKEISLVTVFCCCSLDFLVWVTFFQKEVVWFGVFFVCFGFVSWVVVFFFFPKQEIIKHLGHNIYLNNKDYEIGHFYFIISPVIYIVIQFYTLFQAESTFMTPQKMKQFGHLNLNRILLDKITYNQQTICWLSAICENACKLSDDFYRKAVSLFVHNT